MRRPTWERFVGVLWIVCLAFGCDAAATPPAPTAGTTGKAAAPRKLASLARKVERNDDGQVVTLMFLSSSVTDAELRELADHDQLRTLTLQECRKITDQGLAALQGESSLSTLKLIQVPVSDAGLAHLAGSASLEELLLGHTDVVGDGLAHLSRVPLARLTIHSNVLTAEGLSSLTELKQLRDLEVHAGHLSVADLPSLGQMTELESLVFTRTPLGPGGLARFEGLPRLKRLLLNAADLDDESLAILNTLPQLEELEITGARVTDVGLAQIVLPRLKVFSLADCRHVTDAGLANLRGLSSLETLNLAGSSVAGRDLTGLAGIRTLRRVLLSGAQFRGSDQSIQAVKDLLPDCEIVVLRG